jgi:hypothetical protein
MVVNNSSSYAIQSSNYDGTSGWAIKGDGSVYFASGTFKGNLTGNSFTGGTINIGNYSFNVDSSGNMWMGATTYGSAPFRVSAGGTLYAQNATVTGSISANSIQASAGGLDSTGNIWAGQYSYSGAPFRVSNAGALYANNATLTGSFQTGNISIANGTISAPNWTLYDSGAFYANSANITGNINSGSVIQGSKLAGNNISTGGLDGGGNFTGQRVELMGSNGYDTIRFYPGSGMGSGYVDIRGQTGVWGGSGYINGFYVNGTTQIGNTQSVIYQVGRRDTSFSSSRVRAGVVTTSTTAGSGYVNFSSGMDTAPTIVVANCTSRNATIQTSSYSTGGFAFTAQVGSAAVGDGLITIAYFAETFV